MRLLFLTAARNESLILDQFLSEFAEVISKLPVSEWTLYVVDDLSVDDTVERLERGCRERGIDLRVVRAPTNFGNQGAMFYGLQRIEIEPEDLLVTFDCDGEDDVHYLPEVLSLALENPGKLVLIERGRRSESALFKLAFGIYKLLFRFLTRKDVVPNNYMIIPGARVPAIRRSPLAAVHLAYGVLKLGFPHVSERRDRRPRYGGSSSQNLFSLVTHGMVGLMVFYEIVVARLFAILFLFLGVGFVGVVGSVLCPPEELLAARIFSGCAQAAALGTMGCMALLVAAFVALVMKLEDFTLRQARSAYSEDDDLGATPPETQSPEETQTPEETSREASTP